MRSWMLVALVALSGCERVRAAAHAFTAPSDELGADQPVALVGEALPVDGEPGDTGTTEAAAPAPEVEKGIHVGNDNGVHVGREGDDRGVAVGGEHGVLIGDQEDVNGVRVGGEKGVMVGKDDETKGVRVGGEKGVEVGDKGLSIGGKTVIGKKK